MIDVENGSIIKLSRAKDTAPAKDVQALLVPGETICSVFKGMRDYVMFTDKRITAVNVQGMTDMWKTDIHDSYTKRHRDPRYRVFCALTAYSSE